MNNRPIGMFDSGVGGLTVYKEVKKNMPQEQIIYLGDTKRFPYGSKTKETIIELSKNNIEFLLKKNVKAIVIACGTATSQALDTVKEIYKIPIIGIIDPTVQYVKSKGIKKIGVIATRGTIKSGSWERNLKKADSSIEIQSKACPLLAPMAEEGWTENNIARLTIKEYLKGFKDIDALILGCTHYPMYEKIIREEMPNVEIINTGTVIAKYLESITDGKGNGNPDEFYLTDTECNFLNVSNNILGKKIKIEKAEI